MAAESAPKKVALLFDDGPIPAQAAAFRTLFAAENVRVTWAYEAKEVAAHPEIARAALAAGHEVANHSYAHLHPQQIDDAALRHEIVDAQKVLTAELGVAPRWYWKPFTEADPRQGALWAEAGIRDFDMSPQVWSHDWNTAVDAEAIYRNATTNVGDGSLIIFHEWRAETLAQMPAILAELKRQGCEFVTISELAAYLESKAAQK
ncbi:polysaccharide deacetylase family protein [Synoicihabitans lomoniglobus]|uniref:Polysaccharide deacetylase family protein n=1 Tax=Synoicihabitans lomoniglobus TaxID=2909285 RepID=A0AAF0I5A1_9BACT|nr:polysaccharide deacetylase family protein [Opitutaceae bacterium LMO-M01]WED67258.1 polysaccharide deacetylase family protein [Opitutaceae bacterium LMO-M01]